MSILSDRQIAERCGIILHDGELPTVAEGYLRENLMIDPFYPIQQRYDQDGDKVVSFGLSSFGYDVRLAPRFKLFTNTNSAVVDPLNINDKCFVDVTGDSVLIPPNSYLLGHTMESFRIPRDVQVVCLGKSTYARCFTGDTRVALADGTNPTFVELIERYKKGERLWGYSVADDARVVMSEFTSPRMIGKDAIFEVTLDNGESIRTTGDHEFMVRDGSYVRADSLQPGDSLMPLYRCVTRGYEAVLQVAAGAGFESTHWLADSWNVRNGVYEDGIKQHRHHVDKNRRNNSPPNIVRVDSSKHIAEHNAETYTPEHRARLSEIQKAVYMRNLAANPDFKEVMRQRGVDGSRKFWESDEYAEAREFFVAQVKARGANMSVEERQRRRAKLIERISKQEVIEAHVIRMRKRWEDAVYREMMTKNAARIKVRDDITADSVKAAFEKAGSFRGASYLLKVDRSVFRRFPDLVREYREKWSKRVMDSATVKQLLEQTGTVRGAAKLLGVKVGELLNGFSEVISQHFAAPIADNHKVVSVRNTGEVDDVYCLTVPEFGNFALSAGVFVSNCGAIVNVTPIEPGFEGQVVIEISNATPLPVRVYANQGIAQFLFFRGDEPCVVSYADRGGKYQGQTGIQLALG